MPKKAAKRLGRPPRTEWPACSFAGCPNTRQGGSKGFCKTHYMQTRRGQLGLDGQPKRPPMRVRSYGPGAHCVVEGCLNHSKKLMLGLCSTHYQAHRAGHLSIETATTGHTQTGTEEVCIVQSCDIRARSHNMCEKHAAQRTAGIIDGSGNQLRELLHGGPKPKEGPIINSNGYVLVRPAEGYLGKTQYGRVLEHRYMMEQHLGRLLYGRGHPLYEIVHHKDGNRQNNCLDNLELASGVAGECDGSEDFEETREGHHPGHSITEQEAARALEHLAYNNPAAFADLMGRFSKKGSI